jgi:hypothetical protein
MLICQRQYFPKKTFSTNKQLTLKQNIPNPGPSAPRMDPTRVERGTGFKANGQGYMLVIIYIPSCSGLLALKCPNNLPIESPEREAVVEYYKTFNIKRDDPKFMLSLSDASNSMYNTMNFCIPNVVAM